MNQIITNDGCMKRILIADDSVSSRNLLRSILEGCGYEVAEAADSQMVLEKADDFCPHLVILDFEMSRIEGFPVATALRQKPYFHWKPIVALTAALAQTIPDELVEAGFSTYLVKPIGPSRLRKCVETLLAADKFKRTD